MLFAFVVWALKRSPAASLRATALQTRAEKPHPFFWSPFVLMGHGGPTDDDAGD